MPTPIYNLPDVLSILGLASVTADGNGSGVDISAYEGVLGFVQVCKNTAGTTPTMDNKLQHSEDNVTFTDVTGGAFTQVTDAGSSAQVTQKIEIQKNALKKYVRVAKDIGGTSTPAFNTAVILIAHKKYES